MYLYWMRSHSFRKTGTLSEDWAKGYAARYFGEKGAAEIAARYLEFSGCAVKYGPNEDDRAGEQFANHVPRILMTQFIQDKTAVRRHFCGLSERIP